MDKITYRYRIDAKKHGVQFVLNAYQNDTNTRELMISLLDGGVPVNLGDNVNATLYCEKPDSTVVYESGEIQNNIITVILSQQTVCAAGTVNCQLRIVGLEKNDIPQVLYCPEFEIYVNENNYDDNALESTNEYSAMVEATADLIKAKSETIVATNNANAIANEIITMKNNGDFNGTDGKDGEKGDIGPIGPKGDKGEQGLQGIPGKDAITDSALSPDSNNAIANSAVAKVLDGGKLLGFEVISDYAGYCSFEEHSSKYAAGLTNGGYVVILVTDMVYKDDNVADESQLLLAQGTYILKGMDVILQGVGIKVIQELLDDLDTRYLSYDEWKTVYDLLWSSIQLISESHNKLQEDVENELAKKQDREEWTLLINDTLTQDIATGTKYGWSSDINSNAYSVKELFAEIVFPSELSGNLALQINGADASAIMWGLLPAKTKKVHIHSKMLPDGCIETEYVYKLGSDSEITAHKSLKGINGERRLTAFTKLSISSRPTNGSVALPSGTAIKIWAMK